MTDENEDGEGGQTTITVQKSTLQRFNQAKADTKTDHVPEMSADGFLNSLLDTHAKVKEHGYGDTAQGDVPVPADVREQLDRIESSAVTAEERTGEIQRVLEELGR